MRFLKFGAAILFDCNLAAAVCGTFAWYTYATRTGLEKQYHGTTVGDMGSLQAGLISEVQLEDYLEYDLAEDDRTLADEGKLIYWCKEKIEAKTINYVLNENGYASTRLTPVTTSEYDYTSASLDDFTLYHRPTYRINYNTANPAFISETDAYCRLNFVFRFEDIDNIGEYLPGYDVFLSGCEIDGVHEGHEVYKAARFFFRNGYEQFLINPTANEDGEDVVGGVLDLDADGFYDFDESGYEVIYGESADYSYNEEKTSENGSLTFNERTTFIANHKKDVYAINPLSFEPKVVNYTSIDRFTSKAKAITTMDENYHNLGRFDFFIYYEGWDTHLVDSEQGYGFNLDLTFEVSI